MLRNKLTLFTVLVGALLGTVTVSSVARAQVSPPYLETFESEPFCGTSCGNICTLSTTGWINEPILDFRDWAVDSGGTGSSSTGPSFDHTLGTSSGRYLYTEASGSCSNDQFWLISPQLDLTIAATPAARFWYHMYGSNMGVLHVDILDSAQNVLLNDIIPAFTANINLWQQSSEIDLTPYVGQIIRVRLRSISGSSFRSDMAIDDFELFQNIAHDIGVSQLNGPVNDCGLGMETVTVTLTNGGKFAESNFPIEYSLDGGTPVVENFVGPLQPGASTQYSFAVPANVSTTGPRTFSVTVTVPLDEVAANDNLMATIHHGVFVNTFPSLDDFEGADPSMVWSVGGNNNSWQLGAPAATIINAAASGANAYVTNLTGSYNTSEASYIETLHCYDFSGVGAPAAGLSLWYDTEYDYDGAVLQSTIDNGTSWQTVGAFGDPTAWYDANGISGAPGGQFEGWSGTTGGWVAANHPMFSLGNESKVRFRIAFGSDGSVQQEGVAVDDFTISALVDDDLRISQAGPTSGALVTYQPGDTNVLAQVLDFLNYGPTAALPITAITITNTGDLPDADVVAVKLWLDDGDGLFDVNNDTLADTQVLAAGSATFAPTGLNASNISMRRVFISYDIGPNAMAGSTFSSQIPMPQMDITAPLADTISVIGPPLDGPLLFVGAIVDMLPFYDDFSGSAPNRTTVFQAGVTYPQAQQEGGGVNLTFSMPADSQVELLASNGSLTPVEGTMFYAASYPNGFSAAALDYAFDLSSFTVQQPLWLRYSFTDAGEFGSNFDHIFISLDGGTTWTASVNRFTWANPQGTWLQETIDISEALDGLGAEYTNDVVVRFQTSGNGPLGGDGFLLDSVFLGRPMKLLVEDPMNVTLDDDAVEQLGSVPELVQVRNYTLSNLGDLPLDLNLGSFVINNVNNASDVTITPPMNAQIDPAMADTFSVSFTPGSGGFSFDVEFSANVPELDDNLFNIALVGTGVLALPEIDITRAGNDVPDGSTDAQGEVTAGNTQSLSYTINNNGYIDLYVTNVTLQSPTNVVAEVITTPAEFTAVGESTTLVVEYSASDAGAFNFDIVVGTNDFDEPFYTITVAGDVMGAASGAGGAGGGGEGGVGGMPSGSGGEVSAGGAAGEEPPLDDSCSCRVVSSGRGHSAPVGGAAALLLGAALMLRRRRIARAA